MTIDWTRKRELPCIAVIALRGLAALAFAAAIAADVYLLHHSWHHFAVVERDGWIADYARIKNLIETRYPNLDWAVTEARIDLYRLDLRTTMQLQRAETRAEAEQTLRAFVRAFHDGHLAIGRPDPVTSTDRRRGVSVISAATPPDEACEFLRYEETDEPDFDLDFAGAGSFRALPSDNPFSAGLLRVEGRKLGLVRIPTFDTFAYLPTCVSEWGRFRETLATTCESECEEDFYEAMTARLLDGLAERIGQLRDAGAELLVVDVRGNPGGYGDFRVPVTTLLAGRELPMPGEEVAASEETVTSLEANRDRLETALALCPAPSPARERLEADYRRIDVAIAEAAIPCDRSAVWSDWGIRPPCPGLVPFQSLDAQTTAEVDAATAREAARRPATPQTSRVRTRWHGPLAVLTDRYTGSSAELLAGVLRDYAGATVLGQRSAGAGGGWLFGQTSWPLENSGLELYLPDHASYRRDGTSYQAGVTPDVSVSFHPRDDDATKARALVEGLRGLLQRVHETVVVAASDGQRSGLVADARQAQ